MQHYYFLHRWGRNNQPLPELEGKFTSVAEAVKYLREMGTTTMAEPAAGCRRFDVVSKGVVQRWAVVSRPQRVEDGCEERASG